MSSPYVFVSQQPSDGETSSLLVDLIEHFAASLNTPQLIWLVLAERSGVAQSSDRSLELSRQIRTRWPDCSVVLTISTPEELSILLPTPTDISAGTLSIWAMALPNTFVDAFHLTRSDSSDGSVLTGWPASSPSAWDKCRWLLLIGNDALDSETSWVEKLRDELPTSTPILNFGMPRKTDELKQDGVFRLALNGIPLDSGPVVVRVGGDIAVESWNISGFRPAGEPLEISGIDGRQVSLLNDTKALAAIELEFNRLPTRDQQAWSKHRLVQWLRRFGAGQFAGSPKLHQITQVDPDEGNIEISEWVEEGDQLRLHLFDGAVWSEELWSTFRELESSSHPTKPSEDAAVLGVVSCPGIPQDRSPSGMHDRVAGLPPAESPALIFFNLSPSFDDLLNDEGAASIVRLRPTRLPNSSNQS